jgi:hypothetical protein
MVVLLRDSKSFVQVNPAFSRKVRPIKPFPLNWRSGWIEGAGAGNFDGSKKLCPGDWHFAPAYPILQA